MLNAARVVVGALMLLSPPATAVAQEAEPIGLFAADVRGAFGGYKQTASVAEALGVATLSLPSRGFGLVFGAHLYPVRKGIFAFGIGGERLVSGGRHTIDATPSDGTDGVTVQTRFSSLSPQFSLNFGGRQGWSYLSGGIGRARYTTELADAPWPDPQSGTRAINYGGGARWFAKEHLALSVDLRFYAVSPQDAEGTRPAFPRMTLRVLSVGISVK